MTELAKALRQLIEWKDYKANLGKDAIYERGKEEAWTAARAAIAAYDTAERLEDALRDAAAEAGASAVLSLSAPAKAREEKAVLRDRIANIVYTGKGSENENTLIGMFARGNKSAINTILSIIDAPLPASPAPQETKP